MSDPTATADTTKWFKPLSVGHQLLPSRIALAPINTGFARGGKATWQLLRFHVERSGPAIGISMVGNVAVGHESAPSGATVVLSTSRDVARLAVLARAIRLEGSLPGIQLAHTLSQLDPKRRWQVRDRVSERDRLRGIIGQLPPRDIEAYLASFVQSSQLAVEAGFDVIQIHAAHGYLLSLLTSSEINLRSDRYGYDGLWLDELFFELRRRLGESLLSVRISVLLGLSAPSDEVDRAARLANRIAAAGADVIDLSAGLYTVDRRLIYPGQDRGSPVYTPWLPTLAAMVTCPLVIAGRITDLRRLPPLPKDRPIILSLGRPLIADPRFAEKSRRQEFDSIVACELRNRCHYFSRGRPHVECGVNPTV